jgi:hypothetical protein
MLQAPNRCTCVLIGRTGTSVVYIRVSRPRQPAGLRTLGEPGNQYIAAIGAELDDVRDIHSNSARRGRRAESAIGSFMLWIASRAV